MSVSFHLQDVLRGRRRRGYDPNDERYYVSDTNTGWLLLILGKMKSKMPAMVCEITVSDLTLKLEGFGDIGLVTLVTSTSSNRFILADHRSLWKDN